MTRAGVQADTAVGTGRQDPARRAGRQALAIGAAANWSPTAARTSRRMNAGLNRPVASAARVLPKRSRRAAVAAMAKDMTHHTMTMSPAVLAAIPSWSSKDIDCWRAEAECQRWMRSSPVTARKTPSTRITAAIAASARSCLPSGPR